MVNFLSNEWSSQLSLHHIQTEDCIFESSQLKFSFFDKNTRYAIVTVCFSQISDYVNYHVWSIQSPGCNRSEHGKVS